MPLDVNGNLLATLGGKLWGEDIPNDVLKISSRVVEQTITLPTLNTIFVDSASVVPVNRVKVIYLYLTTGFSWVTAGQATWQPFSSRAAFAQAGGATTQLTTSQTLLGSPVNLGGAGATFISAALYRLSPAIVAELQWNDGQIGVQFQFPSALTGGVATLFLDSAP